MRSDRTAAAFWRGMKMEVHFDGDYRIGSNTYQPPSDPSDWPHMIQPNEIFLKASLLWSDSAFRDSMTFQEFIDKTLG
jgi:hypothetical protein